MPGSIGGAAQLGGTGSGAGAGAGAGVGGTGTGCSVGGAADGWHDWLAADAGGA